MAAVDELAQLQAPPKVAKRENTYILSPSGYGEVRLDSKPAAAQPVVLLP